MLTKSTKSPRSREGAADARRAAILANRRPSRPRRLSMALRSPVRDSVRRSTPSCAFVRFSACAASGRCSLLLLLVHLRVVAAIATLGWNHPRAPSSEGVGHRLALPAAAPTHRALLHASQQGAWPLPDRILRAPCGRWAPGASFPSILDALKLPCRSCNLHASRSARPVLSRCRRHRS